MIKLNYHFWPFVKKMGLLWPWWYGSWIYNYLCNQCLSPLMLWVWISIRARCTTLCDKVCQWPATGRWFPPPINWPPRYNWNIVESDVKHHYLTWSWSYMYFYCSETCLTELCWGQLLWSEWTGVQLYIQDSV